MNVLITGDGFLAYNIYHYLRNTDDKLKIWNYTLHNGQDILDYKTLEKAVEGKDLVIHTAALTHVDFSINKAREDRKMFIDVNHKGTFNVLEACREHKVKMIHISSSEVYGKNLYPGIPMTEEHSLIPMSGSYAVSKAAADMECRVAYEVFGQDVIIIRPFNLYGFAQSIEKLIPRFLIQASCGLPLTINGSGEQTRDYLFAVDCAEAIWMSKDLPAGTILNIGTENAYSINDIADLIIETVKAKYPSRKVYVSNTNPRPNDLEELRGSYKRINELTGWEPKNLLPQGIAKVMEWYFANGAIQPPQELFSNAG
jgi:nucleoside-diphosphate-sugar epimerase